MESCDCGIPLKRIDNKYCLKCLRQISEDRIHFSEISEYLEVAKNEKCGCKENIRQNFRTRTLNSISICNFCDGIGNLEFEDNLELFGDLDIPFALDPNKFQYKVITQKDRFFSSKFNPGQIERALNEYAQEDWYLKVAVSADFGSVGMSRNELIMFMEKKPDGQVDS